MTIKAMFSGIIKTTEKPINVRKNKNNMEVDFPIPKGWNLELGESVNIDGVCTTVKSLNNKFFSVYYMPETLRITTFGSLEKDHVYNLERCLTLQDLISGHLVYGHVDTTATVRKVTKEEESISLTFEIASEFIKYIVYKGSIAVNGVSLTIVEVDKNSFAVSLIPHTLEHTNLGKLVAGSKVNIEVDMLAKHIEKLIESKK